MRDANGKHSSHDQSSRLRDDALAEFFERREFTGVLGGLGDVAFFYNSQVKYWIFESTSILKYTTYDLTFLRGRLPENLMPDKTIRFHDGRIGASSHDGVTLSLNPIWQVGQNNAALIQSQAIDGIEELQLLEAVDLPGGDYSLLKNIPLTECTQACSVDRRCVAFTFNKRNEWCFLKSAIGDRRDFSGATSGIKAASN